MRLIKVAGSDDHAHYAPSAREVEMINAGFEDEPTQEFDRQVWRKRAARRTEIRRSKLRRPGKPGLRFYRDYVPSRSRSASPTWYVV